ncbi:MULTISPECIES: lysozyme inhibitor LprI family protein [Asaia]|uniref:lysozyme inhibitor LprI family protein n=1 Tax=Asaia TaxID=91914 RepID=UPI0004259B52
MGQAGTYDCFEKVRRQEDAALNRDYQRIITLFQRSDQPRLSDREALRQAERNWLV